MKSAIEDLGVGFEFMTTGFFWFIVSCSFASMYTFVMLWLAYMLRVNPWFTLVPPLVPLVILWYRLIKKRIENYMDLLMKPFVIRSADEVIKEYSKLLEEQDSENKGRKRLFVMK